MNKSLSKKQKRKDTTSKTLTYIFLVLLVLLCLIPFYVLLINTTRSNPEIQKGFAFLPGNSFLTNLNNLLGNSNVPILSAIKNSLIISTFAAALTAYFSAWTAYGIHMYRFKGRKFAYYFILVVMMVPAPVSTVGFLELIGKFNMMDTFYPLIIPAVAAPVVFFYMKQYLDSVLPFEVIESSRVDGANELYTFHKIVIPILKPAMAVQFIFAFVGSWNNFFIPALIIKSNMNKTIPLLIAGLKASDPTTFDLGVVYVLIALAIVPLLIMYLFLSRYIIKGITLGSVKG